MNKQAFKLISILLILIAIATPAAVGAFLAIYYSASYLLGSAILGYPVAMLTIAITGVCLLGLRKILLEKTRGSKELVVYNAEKDILYTLVPDERIMTDQSQYLDRDEIEVFFKANEDIRIEFDRFFSKKRHETEKGLYIVGEV